MKKANIFFRGRGINKFFGRPKEFGRDYRFALVRPSVRPYVRPDRFRLNGALVYSDFWYQVSFLWFLEDHGAGFFRNKGGIKRKLGQGNNYVFLP